MVEKSKSKKNVIADNQVNKDDPNSPTNLEENKEELSTNTTTTTANNNTSIPAKPVPDEKILAKSAESAESQQQQQQNKNLVQEVVGSRQPVKAIKFKSEFLDITLTDPNIIDELNLSQNNTFKYATNVLFEGLEINLNKKGGRVVLKTQDRLEVIRDISSGVKRSECEAIEFFTVDR